LSITVGALVGVFTSVGEGGEGETGGAVEEEVPPVDTVEEVSTLASAAGAEVSPLVGAVFGGLGSLFFVATFTIYFSWVVARVSAVGYLFVEEKTVRALVPITRHPLAALAVAVAVRGVRVVLHALLGAALAACQSERSGQ